MKHIFLFLLIIFLAGCKKENDNPIIPDDNTANGYFRAYIDGANWEAEKIQASKSGTNIKIKGI
jgi:type III secretory pathway lipoprotein EscJ